MRQYRKCWRCVTWIHLWPLNIRDRKLQKVLTMRNMVACKSMSTRKRGSVYLASDHLFSNSWAAKQNYYTANFRMFKSGSKSNLDAEFQCKISLLDDTELTCDFKVRIMLWWSLHAWGRTRRTNVAWSFVFRVVSPPCIRGCKLPFRLNTSFLCCDDFALELLLFGVCEIIVLKGSAILGRTVCCRKPV